MSLQISIHRGGLPPPREPTKPTPARSVGSGFERRLGSFLEDAFAPSALGGVFAAVGASQSGRFLARRIFQGRVGPVTHWTLGELGSWGLEVPAFVLATKGIQNLQYGEASWDPESLRQEFLASAVLLGSLKVFSLLGSGVSYQFQVSPWAQYGVGELSALSGLMVGHWGQGKLLHGQAPLMENNFFDSLILHLQFKLTRGVLPVLPNIPKSKMAGPAPLRKWGMQNHWVLAQGSPQVLRAPYAMMTGRAGEGVSPQERVERAQSELLRLQSLLQTLELRAIEKGFSFEARALHRYYKNGMELS
ncbi:MAG: hypothetical protein R3257_06480, partial [bacterium]|nr:hypothetical protein [bacterium]